MKENEIKFDVRDLRIGNYVNVPRKDQSPFRIDAFEYLGKEFGKVAQDNGTYMVMDIEVPFHPLTWELKDLTPIQITPDWLHKLGFENRYGCTYFIGKLKFTYEHNELSQFVRFHYSGKVAYLKYIHQIQNIVFVLTGLELVLTTPVTG